MKSSQANVQRNESNQGAQQRTNVLFLANGQHLLFGGIPTIPWHDGGIRLRETVCRNTVDHVLQYGDPHDGCRGLVNLLRDIQNV